jgi:hypothetical protein
MPALQPLKHDFYQFDIASVSWHSAHSVPGSLLSWHSV